MKIAVEGGKSSTLEQGFYKLKVTGISDQVEPMEFGDVVRIEFEATGDKGEGSFSELFNARITPQSKLGRLITAVMGEYPEVGSDFELNDLLGKTFGARIKHIDRGAFTNPRIDYFVDLEDLQTFS